MSTVQVTYSVCFPDVDPKNCLATVGTYTVVEAASVSASCDAVTVSFVPLVFDSVEELGGVRIELSAEDRVLAPTSQTRGIACSLARYYVGSPLGHLAPRLSKLLDG